MENQLTAKAVIEFVEGWQAHNANRCANAFLEDGVREQRFHSQLMAPGERFVRFEGREVIARAVQGLWAAMPDATLEIQRMSDDHEGPIWVEWVIRGTHTVDFRRWKAQGESVYLPGVSIYAMENDFIREERIYLDPAILA